MTGRWPRPPMAALDVVPDARLREWTPRAALRAPGESTGFRVVARKHS